jgi:transcriptional regulator with XRE-family HTH domain
VTSRNDNRGEIRQFLTTRRARLTPEQAGLPSYGGNRRVPRLRREEVALLAGIWIEYYTRFERGNARGASEEVLDGIAHAAVGSLRAEAGRDPQDRALTDLVGELSVRSQEFRVRWAAHDVDFYRSGVQRFHHPLVGDLTLNYDALELPADPGQAIVAYTGDPASPAQQALDLLASWTATPGHAPAATSDHDT